MNLQKFKLAQTIVIIAQRHNPSIFNHYWLIKNGIIKEDELLSDSIFHPELAVLSAPEFKLTVEPEKMQIDYRLSDVPFQEVIESKLLPIVKKLPEVPYKAIGLNYTWALLCDEAEFAALSKKLFFNTNTMKFYDHFDKQNARFGAYLSKDFESYRLRLDVKPITISRDGKKTEEILQFAFNYHRDLNENPSAVLVESLMDWNNLNNETNYVIDLIDSTDENDEHPN